MRIHGWKAAALLGASLALTTAASAALIEKGKAAPTWSGKTTKGKAISSAQFKGKAVLVNFFSYG